MKVDFDYANSSESIVKIYSLVKINLENVNLRDAHLEGAYLENAHLEGAHLEKAYLKGAHLENIIISESDLPKFGECIKKYNIKLVKPIVECIKEHKGYIYDPETNRMKPPAKSEF